MEAIDKEERYFDTKGEGGNTVLCAARDACCNRRDRLVFGAMVVGRSRCFHRVAAGRARRGGERGVSG